VFVLGVMTGCADRAGGGRGDTASPETPATPPASGPAAWATITGTVSDAVMVVPSAVGESTPPVPEIAVASDERGRYAWPTHAGQVCAGRPRT